MKFYKYSTGDSVMRHKIIDKYFNKVSVHSLSELIQWMTVSPLGYLKAMML